MHKNIRMGIFYCAWCAWAIPVMLLAASPHNPQIELEPIVVTKPKTHLIQPYFLSSQSFRNAPFSSLIETMSMLPVDLQSRYLRGDIQTDFSLRGSTFQGVVMLLNGQRINDPQTAHHNSDIPFTKEDIERIEVFPGVGSSVFGPDAMGGAVNILIKKPKEKKVIVETSIGSYQTGRGVFSASEKIGPMGVRFSAERAHSSGFYDDTEFEKITSSFSASYDFSQGNAHVNWGYLDKEFGAYDFYTPKSGFLSKEWTKTYLGDLGFELEKAGFFIKPNLIWRKHYDKFALDRTTVRSRYLNHHRTDVLTPNLYLQRQLGALGKVGLGVEYGSERIKSTNLGKRNRIHRSIFIDDSNDVTEYFSYGGTLRWDNFDGFDKVVTGSANTKYYFLKNHALTFGISHTMRVPSFTELYYNDPTTVGDDHLSAEQSINYQAGYEGRIEKSSFGATFFVRQEDEVIDWVKRTPSQARWQVENITQADVIGIDGYFKHAFNNYINLVSNYVYTDRSVREQGLTYKYGPNYARHLLNLLFEFNLPFGIQSIGVTYKKKPERNGWLLLSSRLSYNLSKYSQLFLEATNLLNVEYQEIEGIPQPGRWVESGLRFEW